MSNWKEFFLKDIIDTNVSLYSKKDNYKFVNYLDTGNITENCIKEIQYFDLNLKKLPSRARRKTKYNSILYSTVRPNQKHYGIIKSEINNLLVSTGFTVIDVKTDIADPDFIYFFLTQKEVIDYLQAIAEQSTSTYPSIKVSDIENLKINLPTLKKQQQLSSILNNINKKININTYINDNLVRQIQTLYYNFFGKFYQTNWPNDWKASVLGDVVWICNKVYNPKKEPDVLLEHYSIPAYDDMKFPIFEYSTNIKSNKFIVDNNCFLISKLNPTIKRIWRPYCLTQNCVCSTEFIVYKAKNSKYTDFLYSLIDSDNFLNFMCSHVTGSTGSRQRTTPSDTLQYNFAMPPDEYIQKFNNIVHPMHNKIRETYIEIYKLKQLRDLLMPKLIFGEIEMN